MVKKICRIVGLDLMVSTACNLHCPKCYGHMRHQPDANMDLETGKKAADFAFENRKGNADENRLSIVFFGGEPLLNWDFIKDFLDWLCTERPDDEYNYDLFLFTNGLLLDERKVDLLHEYKIQFIISLDGEFEDQVLRRPMSRERYDSILNSVKYIISKGWTKYLKIYSLIMKERVGEIPRILDFFRRLGVTKVELSKVGDDIWTYYERDALFKAVSRYKEEFPMMRFSFNPESAMNCITCNPRFILVYPNGDVFDLCYLCASIIHRLDLLTKKDIDIMYFGNLDNLNKLKMDVSEKQNVVSNKAFCPTIQRFNGGRLDHLK